MIKIIKIKFRNRKKINILSIMLTIVVTKNVIKINN